MHILINHQCTEQLQTKSDVSSMQPAVDAFKIHTKPLLFRTL